MYTSRPSFHASYRLQAYLYSRQDISDKVDGIRVLGEQVHEAATAGSGQRHAEHVRPHCLHYARHQLRLTAGRYRLLLLPVLTHALADTGQVTWRPPQSTHTHTPS